MNLLRSQMNTVFEILTRSGLDPADFQWKNLLGEGDRESAILTHVPSDYFCEFISSGTQGLLIAAFSPGEHTLSEASDPESWPGLIWHIDRWASYLAREVLVPSLWEEMAKRIRESPTLGYLGPGGNTPFTSQEIEALRAEIGALRGRVDAVQALTDEQAAKVEAALGYMRDSLGRLGRFDWRHAAAATLIAKGVEIGLPAVTNLLLRFAQHLMGADGHVVQILPPGDSV